VNVMVWIWEKHAKTIATHYPSQMPILITNLLKVTSVHLQDSVSLLRHDLQ